MPIFRILAKLQLQILQEALKKLYILPEIRYDIDRLFKKDAILWMSI